jgi:hypothetical protein
MADHIEDVQEVRDPLMETELEEIKRPVSITDSADNYIRLLKSQIKADKAEIRAMASSTANQILIYHLFKMLDEIEVYYQHHNRFESVEFAQDYIEAAYAARVCGRKSDIIPFVEDWLKSDDSLPFAKRREL